MSESWPELIHGLATIAASFVFFMVGLIRAVALWTSSGLTYEIRLLRRIEATGYFIASQVLSIYLYVKWH